MKKQILIFAFGLLVQLMCAQQKNDQQLAAEFDKILSEQYKANEPGATALVSRNGQVIYMKAFGMGNLELNIPMKTDNVFRIGSITKQFTAVSILQLVEQGKLNLKDEITKFIPDYPTQGATITIENLLTHTSGIEDFTALPDYQDRMMLDLKPTEIIDHFKDKPLKFTPGTKWSYSNSNYILLGHTIEIISGQTYAEYLAEHIFKPAGMTNTFYASDIKLVDNRAGAYSHGENGFENAQPISMTQPYAAGSIQSTVEDYFKWHQALFAHTLVKKESLAKAYTNYKLTDGKESDYGYGWKFGHVYDSPSIWHGGAINGFGTVEIYLPKEDVLVVIFSNCDCSSPKESGLLLAAVASGKTREYKEVSVDDASLAAYAGVYENAKGQQRIISVSDKKLYSQLGRGPKSNLKPYQKDQFFFNAMQTIDFSRNKNGKVDKLTTKNLGGNDVWQKTNKPMPSENGINVDSTLLDTYVGQYEVAPNFVFSVTHEQGHLFLQAPGQEKVEMFAETPTKFFLKVNDAQIEFVKDDSGKVTSAILNQGGRQANCKKIS
jgi:CubicO group peptidase (beta-lactamase class C family)